MIEVDLPIREISAHARREKSIRHGHISIKTRDRRVGGPQRVDLPTELDARTVATPLTGVPVDVRFPGGGGTSLTTDAEGRVTLDLPDDPAHLLPLTYLVRITVPGRNAEYTITAAAVALALLPPTVRARADALAANVRETQGRYEVTRSAADAASSRDRWTGRWRDETQVKGKPESKAVTILDLWSNGTYQTVIGKERRGVLVSEPFGLGPFVTTDAWEVLSPESVALYNRQSAVEPRGVWVLRGKRLCNGDLCVASATAPAVTEPRPRPVTADETERAKSARDAALAEYRAQLPTDPYDLAA